MQISKTIFRAIALLAVTALIAYVTYSTYKNRRVRAERENAGGQILTAQTKALVLSLHAMIERHQANDKWIKALMRDEIFRISPILTVELQEQWIGNKPIFLIGSLVDISKKTDGNYNVQVARSFSSGDEFLVSNDISIEVSCAPDQMQSFLKSATDPARNAGRADTAIIAHIADVSSKVNQVADGQSIPTLIGVGKCVEILFSPESIPSNWRSIEISN